MRYLKITHQIVSTTIITAVSIAIALEEAAAGLASRAPKRDKEEKRMCPHTSCSEIEPCGPEAGSLGSGGDGGTGDKLPRRLSTGENPADGKGSCQLWACLLSPPQTLPRLCGLKTTLIFTFLKNACVGFASTFVCAPHECLGLVEAIRGPLDLLELELWTVVGHHACVGNRTLGSPKEQVLLTAELFLRPQGHFSSCHF